MQVAVERIEQYDQQLVREFMLRTLRPAMQARDDIRKVLVKPNMLGAFTSGRAVTTHPVVVEQAIAVLQDMGLEVVVGDSPGGNTSSAQVYEVTGIAGVAQRRGVPLLDFKRLGVREVKVDDVTLWLSEALYDCDAVVNLAKYKTHSLMLYTGAVKNLYGLIPGLNKSMYHRDYPRPEDFMRVLRALYAEVRPRVAYSILDGIIGMEGEGPSGGKPRRFGVLMASQAAGALDHTAAGMMGFTPQQVPYVQHALALDGLAAQDVVVPPEWQAFIFTDVDTASVRLRHTIAARVPAPLRKVFRKLFDFYPAFTADCVRCGICVRSCPVNALELGPQDSRPRLRKKDCIRCMCCHEMCPHSAVQVRKSWLARRIIKR